MSTYLLVHGAWHGGWCWKAVKQELEKSNHQVFTPTMTGLGERRHLLSKDISVNLLVDDIVNVIIYEELSDVILVGHSFGGAIISAVAEKAAGKIQQLIYLDAAVLEHNESMFNCMPPVMVQERKLQAKTFSQGLSLPTPSREQLGILAENDWRIVADKLTPHPLSSYDTPLTLENLPGMGFQSTYIKCIAPEYAPLAWARARVKNYGWPVVTLNTGHDAMVTAPKLLTHTLMNITNQA